MSGSRHVRTRQHGTARRFRKKTQPVKIDRSATLAAVKAGAATADAGQGHATARIVSSGNGLGIETPAAELLARYGNVSRLRGKDIERLKSIRQRWVQDEWGAVRFVLDATRVQLVPDQVDALCELTALMLGMRPGKMGLTVVSGHGCGKTVLDVLSGLYVLCAFDESLVVATSPKQQQLFDNLWAECKRVIDASDFLKLTLDWTQTRISVKGGSPNWHMVARVARKGENIAGGHANTKLTIVDEASGVEEEVFEPLIGGMSGERNVIMLTGNGTRTSGEFFRSHRTKEAKQWIPLTFNARRSPLVSKEHIARMEKKYGKKSPIVVVRVDGGFPQQGAMALFSIHSIEMARGRTEFAGWDTEKLCIGVDVALFGKDYSAACVRQGPNVKYLKRWNGYDSIEGAVEVVRIVKQYPVGSVQRINVDANGWGRGLYDTLARAQDGTVTLEAHPDAREWLDGIDIVAVMVTEKSAFPDEYYSLRDELWYGLANRYSADEIAYSNTIDEDEIDTLESELSVIDGGFHKGKLQHKVKSKEEMAKSLHGSPDLADATCLSFYMGGIVAVYF